MKVAIFVVCIGSEYKKHYMNIFYPFTVQYCRKHNYDLHVIDCYIGHPEHHQPSCIHMMKWLAPITDLAFRYDRVMVIDADIIINPILTPPIHTLELDGKIGVVDEFSQPTVEKRLEIQRKNKWELTATEYYKTNGFDIDTKMLFNSGMCICEPKIHFPVFQEIASYMEAQMGFVQFEQRIFGYVLQKNNIYKVLPNEWNTLWFFARDKGGKQELKDVAKSKYLLHMTSGIDHDLVYDFFQDE